MNPQNHPYHPLHLDSSEKSGDEVPKAKPKGMRRVSLALGLAVDVEDRSRSLLNQRFDYCFWMGDLNYRLELEISEIKRMLAFAEMLNIRKAGDVSKAPPSSQLSISSEEELKAQDDADLNARALLLEMVQLENIKTMDGEDRDSGDERMKDEDDDDEEGGDSER